MDAEQWRWIWIAAAVILAIGELLTAGFFLLPFAVGAAAAAALAFAGVPIAWQIITFAVVSLVSLGILQRFAKKDRDVGETVKAGGDRYIGRSAIVLRTVRPYDTSGMVKVGTEEWKATVDGDSEIPEGARVTVTEVRGTRLIVEHAEVDTP